ncbi:UDP-glycosyltransferase 92A1-like [Citrus sinensis]|nr:UDP-glycosyltransferase 92A1 [Citrus x clementina]XP_006493672.1 UDP-glycosyltransferase 92A1-like [Citrus sinensis]
MAQRKENIVMFPLMAQGHIIPFLALALHLENTNRYTITFVNTPSNLKKLKSSLPQNSSIHLREIPFDGIAHDLPPCTENTDSLPFHLFPNFFESTLSFKPHFRKLINGLFDEQNGHKPVCIIADMFFAWSAEIAQEYGIFNALFVGGGSFGFACFYSLWLNLPHRDSDEFLLPDFPEASRIHVTQMTKFLRLADGSDSLSVFFQKVLPQWMNADGILFNTVEELDKIGLIYFSRKLGRPVWPVGPLLLSTGSRAGAGKEYGISTESCKNWLDTKPCNSVIYVSFGSQNTIAASQMMQLAMALEACGKNFIWVVKPPLGFDLNSEFRANEWLPEGFEERIKDSGQGLVVQKWAPQVEILSHKSISAFLSHCGWNSVLEALSHGVPIIGWPLAAEQFYNSKLLEEVIGVCVEVARGMNCEVSKENLSAKFELVMNETEKGMDLRKKASEVEMIIKNAVRNEEKFKGSSVKAMEQFLDAALMMKKAQKEED